MTSQLGKKLIFGKALCQGMTLQLGEKLFVFVAVVSVLWFLTAGWAGCRVSVYLWGSFLRPAETPLPVQACA